ncbi:hypothetical protein PG987_012352 [Apiospora arundinis]|uniref:Protamine p1 n=1 Tax=Apiospora arundinis TaxID=335852 RepID=A0ABR2IFZ3_9PEZI
MDMDWWEQVQPRQEPLHYTVPQNPEDVLYLGSDNELDDTSRAAKRQRYEEKGRQYIRGRPLRLFSASLRGPFDKSSGWQNPWIPKDGNLLASSSLRPTITKPAAKIAMRRNTNKLDDRADSTPDTRGSMQCHLPSPESNRDLQLNYKDSIEPDKLARIETWAKDVVIGGLEKDSFWAPAPAPAPVQAEQDSDNATNKRPAGNNWLKSKLSKRSKADHPSSSALMTPTPAIPPLPNQLARLPSFEISQEATNVNQQPSLPDMEASNIYGAAQGMAQLLGETSRVIAESSCEQLQAPHSPTRDINPTSLPSDAHIQAQLPAGNDNGSETSSDLSSLQSSEISPGSLVLPNAQAYDLPNLNAADASQDTIEEATASGNSHTEEADDNFESHLDQSFHYRTRPSRKDASRPMTAEPAAAVPLSQLTQTGTPVSQNHRDSVTFKGQQALADEVDTVFSRSESPGLISKDAPHFIDKAPSVVSSKETEDQQQLDHPQLPILLPPEATAETTHSPLTTRHNRLNSKDCNSHIPTDQESIRIDQPKYLATTEDASKGQAVCSKGSFSSTIVDGDTLVADVMDVDDQPDYPGCFQPPERLDAVKHTPSAPSLAARASTLAPPEIVLNPPSSTDIPTSSEVAKHGITDSVSPNHGSDKENAAVQIPTSQKDWGFGERAATRPACLSSAAVERSPPPLISQEVEGASEKFNQHILDSDIQQELLAMETKSTAADDILQVKAEPIDEVSVLDASINHITDPSDVALDQSTVRPSQQSPWGMANPDVLLEIKNESQATNTGVPRPGLLTSPNPTSQLSSQQQSPWGGIEAQAAVRPYGSISVASLLNVSPQWSRSQPQDTPNNLLQVCVSSDPIATPQTVQTREETPEPELSVKSFAKFNTPSPKRRSRGHKYPRLSGNRLSSTQVLVDITNTNPWSSQGARSNRRVSFAPLPCEEKDSTDIASPQAPRPASPPPAITPGADDDDTDCRFHKHFDAMKNRGDHQPKLGVQERLLPSESQQKPLSPEVGAMAEAFREADGFHISSLLVSTASSHNDEEAPPASSYHQDDEPAIDAPQTPWREESQGLDAVAEVMQNLDDFLNPQWGEESDLGMAF